MGVNMNLGTNNNNSHASGNNQHRLSQQHQIHSDDSVLDFEEEEKH